MTPPSPPARPRHRMTPEAVLRAPGPWWVASTLFVAWLLNLLPLGRWPGLPDAFLLVLLYWVLYAPERIGMVVGFIAGLFLDVHNARLLGEHALAFTLAAYLTSTLRPRLIRFGALAQLIHLLPIILVASGVTSLFHAILTASWPGWWWLADGTVTALCWPLAVWVLQLPQRWSDTTDKV